MKPLAIKSVDFFRAAAPLAKPIADSTHELRKIGFIVTRIELHSGVVGEGYLLAFHYSPQAILGALRDIRDLAIGFEVNQTGWFIQEYEKESEYFGHGGIQRWALGSINLAMWDAWTKTLEQPVWRLFGTYREHVPLYGSGGWLSYSMDELLEEVLNYARCGFRAIKVKVGSPEWERDFERLRRVREAVGPRVDVMMDANQGLSVDRALQLAQAARPLRITWFEEPISHTDFGGYEQLRRQTGLALAMGEREYDTVALRELTHRNALDLWQPDILRLGGVEGWRASAALAEAHHLPVLPHFYKEYDVPLLMTVPNGLGAESFDWVDDLVSHPMRIKDGFAYPNEAPGWGFCFKDEKLNEV